MTPVLLAITLAFVVTLCYVAVCAVSPSGNCRMCVGLGFRMRPTQGSAEARQGLPPLQRHRQAHTHRPLALQPLGARVPLRRFLTTRPATARHETDPAHS